MILFIVTVAMSLVRMLLDANYRSDVSPDILPLAAFILTLVLVSSLIIRGIANGRRWIVVLVAVSVAITLPVIIKELAADLRNNVAWFIWETLAEVLTITALALLFGRPARQWFQECKAARS